MKLRLLISILLLFMSVTARADGIAEVTSPNGILSVEVSDSEGFARYTVKRFGETIIAPSTLGFRFQGALKLERDLKITNQKARSFDETWEQPWGESRYVRNNYNELRVSFQEASGFERRFDVVFRVYDYGVGFRYEVPDQQHLKDAIIIDELTEFAIAQPATAWWIPAGEWNRYEYLYQKTPANEVGTAHTPMTVKTDDGLHIAFHEAALVDYSGMWLKHKGGQVFEADLAPASEGWKVRRNTPFVTPWRTMQITDTAAKLYTASNLILNLNEPNKLGDVSWFKPHKYVGVWWEMHLDKATWGSGPRHGATTDNTKRYIDFAAKHGFRGVLVEGWNEGWDGSWFDNGRVFSFTKPYPDFDLKGLTDYAKKKGVHLIGHHETSGAVSHYESQMEAAYDLYESLGIDAVKSGYVANGGDIERIMEDGSYRYEWHDGQWMSRHHLHAVMEAAKRRIAVNPHEPIKDTGLRRTYPNWISREGARGMEYAAWGSPTNSPEHEVNLVFTRMLSGPMDFTPGILSLEGRGQAVQTTIAKQLANYVVLYSPIQMAADLPENYEKHLDAFQFIKDVAVDWAETRVLNGEVGDYVTFARKDRNSDDWYLGSITDEFGRHMSVPLSFLDPARRYEAQIYRDGQNAHWQDNPFDIIIEKKVVRSSDTLDLRLAAGGGTAIRFKALK